MLQRRFVKAAVILGLATMAFAPVFALIDFDLNVRLQLILDGVPFARVVTAMEANSQKPYSVMASNFIYKGQTEIGLVDGGGGVELDRDLADRGEAVFARQVHLSEGLICIGFLSAALTLIAICCWTPRIDLKFPRLGLR